MSPVGKEGQPPQSRVDPSMANSPSTAVSSVQRQASGVQHTAAPNKHACNSHLEALYPLAALSICVTPAAPATTTTKATAQPKLHPAILAV